MKNTCTIAKFSILTAILFCSFSGNAQLIGWSYKVPVQITNSSASPRLNYQELITVNTQTPIGAGNMQASGNDIRLGDSCASIIYQHYVESGINTPSTKIWVMIPSIPAGTTLSIWMFYGNPAAINTSSFPAVFPNPLITGGTDVTLTGTQTYDWFQVDALDTLFVSTGATLTINARNVIINGVVYGGGRGNQAPVINTAGTGTGSGGTSVNAGCGGGSYAGTGGTGGNDMLPDVPGTGGPTYGTASGSDFQMGSSGGSGSSVGGSGGGAFSITAEFILLNGSINMSGALADSTSDRGGGGGSGGCVKITANTINNNGTITAKGGGGAPGRAPANDGGGGGGGGRIKLFYDASLTGSGATNVNGGAGGPFGFVPGQAGTLGTIANVVQPFEDDIIVVGAQSGYATSLSLTLSDPDTSICFGTPFTVTGNAGFSNYAFYLNGVPLSSSSVSSYTYNGLVNNDSISVQASSLFTLCSGSTLIKYFRVKVSPVVTYVQSPGMVCDTIVPFTLTPGTPAGGTYSGPGITGNIFSPGAAGFGTHNIVYTYTDIPSGCVVPRTSQILVDICPGISINTPPDAISVYAIANGKFIVDSKIPGGEIRVYNVMGEVIYELKIITTKSEIDLSDKVQGVYFFEVTTDKEKIVRKIVKQ